MDRLPKGLQAAYETIYSDISSQPGGKPDVAFSAFKILMCSWRPLSPAEMVIAATQDVDEDFCIEQDVDIGYVLDAYHNLMVVADGHGDNSRKLEGEYLKGDSSDAAAEIFGSTAICRFAHLSVREFFEQNHWSLAEAHAHMACVCLRTLLRLQWGGIRVSHHGSSDGTPQQEKWR